ncbi:MAG: MlaD family protein [Planctomycetota bacterium]
MWLGFIFLTAVFLTIVAILIVENWDPLSEPYYMAVGFEHLEGLREGNDVRVEGVLMGKVQEIQLHPEGVLVIVRLDEKVEVFGDYTKKNGYKIYAEPYSILGGNQIAIRRGKPSAGPPRMIEKYGQKIFAGMLRPDALRQLGDVIGENRDTIQETIEGIRDAANKAGGTLDSVSGAADEAKKTLEGLNTGKGTVGRLLTDDEIYEDIRAITAKINRGLEEGTLGKLLTDDTLYNNLVELTEKARTGKGILPRLLYDEELGADLEKILENVRETSADLRDIVRKVKQGEGTVGKLLQDEDLYDTAKRTLEGLDQTIGRAGRAKAWLGADYKSYAETEHSISRVFVRFEPDETKYFQAGAAFMSFSADGDNVVFEDQVEKNDDQLFLKPEILLAYRVPWYFKNHLTVKAGMLEGKIGGGIDFYWEDWGSFQHRVDVCFEIRDAYNDLEDEDLDENIGGPMTRLFLKTPVFPKMDGWAASLLHNVKFFAGVSRLQDDPEFTFGIGLEFIERDVRTLIGLLGTGM